MFTNIMDTSSVRNIKFRAIEPPPNHHCYCQHFCLVVQNVSGWCISPSLHYSQLPTEVIVPSPWPSLGVCLMRSALHCLMRSAPASLGVCLMRSAALIVTHIRISGAALLIICINGSIYMKRRLHRSFTCVEDCEKGTQESGASGVQWMNRKLPCIWGSVAVVLIIIICCKT